MRSFRSDDRGIEGLPIRLVIALVVGVASLGVMMNMISGISGLTSQELDVKPEPEVVSPGEQQVTIAVVGPDGDGVEGATVIVKSGSAEIESVVTGTTGENGTVTLSIDPELGMNQAEGSLVIDVKPPASGGFTDERDNTRILVVEE